MFEKADSEGTVDISKASQYCIKGSFATVSMPPVAPPRSRHDKYQEGLARKQAYDSMLEHLDFTAREVGSIARPSTDEITLSPSSPQQDSDIQGALPRTLLVFSTKQEEGDGSSVYLIVPSSGRSARAWRSFRSAGRGTLEPILTPIRDSEISLTMQELCRGLAS